VKDAQAARLERWVLQAAARSLVPHERIKICYRYRVPGKDVSVWYAELVARAHYKGLMTCGSVWTCPICTAKITERRRIELTEAIEKAKALQVVLATFTMHHDRRDKLPILLDDLLASYRFLKAGRCWAGIEVDYELIGSVRELEPTYWINGWHPHLHVLFFANGDIDLSGFGDVLKERWLSVLAVHGRTASEEHGVKISDRRGDVARYVAKFGYEPKAKLWTVEHELTKSPSKLGTSEHRTPMQLLRDYMLGDVRSGELWKTYVSSFKGKRQLVWSRGLRHALGLDEEKTDEELAGIADEPSVLLATLSLEQWRAVLEKDLRGELLKVADSGNAGKVQVFVESLGVGEYQVGHDKEKTCAELRERVTTTWKNPAGYLGWLSRLGDSTF
jgi:hypothetical protein